MATLKITFCLLASVVVGGCANSASKSAERATVDHTKILAAIEKSAKVIAEAQRVSAESQNALRTITMTEQQRDAYQEAMGYIPPNMEKPISFFAKNQELETAARTLAMLTNYDFNVVNPGHRPRTGVLISIESQGRAAYDIARDMGTQAGVLADLNVMPYPETDRNTSKHGLIEVVYK